MKVREWLAKTSTFEGWMAIAEVVDALRIFPRIVLLYVLWFVSTYMLRLLQFFFDLSPDDKEKASIVAFVTVVTGVLGLVLTKTTDLYNSSARDWAAYHAQRKAPHKDASENLSAQSIT